MEQIAWLVVVALYNITVVISVLTSTGTVDADVARERNVNICLWESCLIGLLRGIKGQEGVVPC